MAEKKYYKLLTLFLSLAMIIGMMSAVQMRADATVGTATITVGGIQMQFGDPAYPPTSPEQDMRFVGSNTNYTVEYTGDKAGYYPYTLAFYIPEGVGNFDTLKGQGGLKFAELGGDVEEVTNKAYYTLRLSATGNSSLQVKKDGNVLCTLTFHAAHAENTGEPGVFAALPAPGQFTNEGIGSGGWGDIFTQDGQIKGMMNGVSNPGLSLGFFGGYTVFDFGEPAKDASGNTVSGLFDNPNNSHGVDFIVYGNAFVGNSEPGSVQVSKDGINWYELAGSKYYAMTTKRDHSLTYMDPGPGNNINVPYIIDDETFDFYEVATNGWHQHPWFPQNANYFQPRTFGNLTQPEMSKHNYFPFVTYGTKDINGESHLCLKLTGSLIDIDDNKKGANTFGYFDCHTNGSADGTPGNPYTFAHGNGDGMDIAWAVNADGTPVSQAIMNQGFRYVRVYNSTAKDLPPFGELSPEICGIKRVIPSTSGSTSSVGQIKVNNQVVTFDSSNIAEVSVTAGTNNTVTVEPNGNILFINEVKHPDNNTLNVGSISSGQSETVRIIVKDSTTSNPCIKYLKLVA